jgi:hypothetical protein
MDSDLKPELPHKRVLGFRDRHSEDLTLHRYQTHWSILDESEMPRVAFLLSRKLKAFGMNERTRTSLSYVFVDIERDAVDKGVFGGFWYG